MNWIKASIFVIVAMLGGCASQKNILPQPDQKMVDIYRDALSTSSDVTVAPASEAVCEDLDLDESIAACQATIEEHELARYLAIDAQEAQPALDYVAYTRNQETEINNLFPRLKNPDISIYIYPHLGTRYDVPIPGYSTVIPLYKGVKYRLPGEGLAETPNLGATE